MSTCAELAELTRAGKLAEEADAARIAGQAFERSYDALTVQENARRGMVFSPSTP